MEAITYLRFSSREQRKGSSKARQTRDLEAICAEKGWEIVERVSDEGLSAWSGAHRLSGAFGRLEREIINGDHRGRVLVVEHLDRLSREDSDETWDLIRSIVRAGVTVFTINDRSMYEGDKKLDLLSVMKILIASEQAHKESEMKSGRIRESYTERRANARATGKPITTWAPAWVERKGDKFVLIEKRAALIREIFRMADNGLGARHICNRLNERKEPTWTTPRSREPRGWHYSRITRLLVDRAVLGEYQPHIFREKKRIPEGLPIAGYFPAALADADLFQRVIDGAAGRKAVVGRKSKQLRNLAAGKAKCEVCGGSFVYRMQAPKGATRVVAGREYVRVADESYLLCDNNYRRAGCSNKKRISYPKVEEKVLDIVLPLALDDNDFANHGEVSKVRTEVAMVKREHEIADGEVSNLYKAYASNGSDRALSMAQEAESRVKALKTRLDDLDEQLRAARGMVDAKQHLARVADIRATLTHDDQALRYQARAKVAAALAQIIDQIVCSPSGAYEVSMAGMRRTIMVKADGETRVLDWEKMGYTPPTDDPHTKAYLRRRDATTPADEREVVGGGPWAGTGDKPNVSDKDWREWHATVSG